MPHPALSPHAPVTISIGFVHGLLSGLSGLSGRRPSASDLLAEAGIAEELLQFSAARVSAEQYAMLFRCMCRQLDDECIGFLSRPFKRGSYGLMAQSALRAQDLHQAILRAANTFRVLQDDLLLELVSDKRQAGFALQFINPAIAQHEFVHVFLLRSLWRLFDWLVGGDLTITRFDLAFAPPPNRASYAELFNGPIEFNCPVTALWFDSDQLKSPVRVDENALLDLLDAQTRFIIPGHGKDEVSAKVLGYLHQSRPAWPDLDATAVELCMSPASLQRNLAKEGTSFQALKDRLRRDMAITYLSTTPMSLTELADKLGFTERASFQRAFKAWTGSTPGSYRQGVKDGG